MVLIVPVQLSHDNLIPAVLHVLKMVQWGCGYITKTSVCRPKYNICACGESLVVAIAIGGTTSLLCWVQCLSDSNFYLSNNYNSVALGFLANPRIKNTGPTVIACCRLIAS
jgi:hypothetical protein